MRGDAPSGYLVLGTHRQQGGIIVWCGVGGFVPLERLLERRDLHAQLVTEEVANALARESNRHYELRVVAVRDITYQPRPSLIQLPH